MHCVVVELAFDPPVPPEAYPDVLDSAAWCFRLHGVEHRRAHIALDGHKSACVFDAPDAEAVRIALRQIGDEDALVWPATVHDPPPAAENGLQHGARIVVVERAFAAPAPFAEIQAIEERGAWCLEEHGVHFLRTYASLDERRMLCLYAAPDAEAVRLAQRKAAVPFDRVWPARLLLDP